MEQQSDSPSLEQIISRYADRIVSKGLGVPAVLFLEMHKPLTTLSKTALEMGLPLLHPILGPQFGKSLLEVLESRESFEELICEIERRMVNPAR